MLDRKLKEQIYYGYNQPKQKFDDKAFYTLVAVIVGFALIVAVISINSNNTTHYEQPKQERNLDNLVGEQTETTQKQEIPEEKTYTEAEIQADIKAYKNKFIAKVKQNWHPNEESFLIDNDSLQVKVDKNGNVTFPNYPNGSYDANSHVIIQAVEDGRPYSKLPDSYNSDSLTFKIYFEGNTESYWGNAQPKSSYQVSLSPIKTVTKLKATTNNTQKSSSTNTSMDEFYKMNSMHASQRGNTSEYGEFGSFVTDKTPQKTKDIIKQTVPLQPQKINTKTTTHVNKQKTDLQKSTDDFFE